MARLQIKLEVGGIYMDTDAIVLKPVDELRNYKMVLAEEQQDGLSQWLSFLFYFAYPLKYIISLANPYPNFS